MSSLFWVMFYLREEKKKKNTLMGSSMADELMGRDDDMIFVELYCAVLVLIHLKSCMWKKGLCGAAKDDLPASFTSYMYVYACIWNMYVMKDTQLYVNLIGKSFLATSEPLFLMLDLR